MIFEKISSLCEERGISVHALEKELGFGKSTILRWRTASPGVDKLKMVADYFEVPIDFLVAEDDGKAQGKFTVYAGGEAVCGSSFDSMMRLMELVKIFARGKSFDVEIHFPTKGGFGDGAGN